MQIFLYFCSDFYRTTMETNSQLERILSLYDSQQIFVIADVNAHYEHVLGALPYPTLQLSVSAATKSLDRVTEMWDFLNNHHATRHALLVLIGGGTLTDMGGFAAATYLRGIDYVNVPTTLLAMVDASIGGKTGVNYAGLKNRIGAFHQPIDVVIEPRFLETLPETEWLSGWGEVIKTTLLSESHPILHNPSEQREAILPIIRACAVYKKAIVADDPTEQGLRKVLNLGHTVGHALEEVAGGQMAHGYAVVYGLVAALYLSVVRLDFPREILTQVTHIMVEEYGRPICNCKEIDTLIDKMRADKKNATHDGILFTLLRQPGEPVYNQAIPEQQIREAVDYLFSV